MQSRIEGLEKERDKEQTKIIKEENHIKEKGEEGQQRKERPKNRRRTEGGEEDRGERKTSQ